jgi:general secretion pathway protein G
MKAKSGFTLVEILIVVVILGILAAIVIPQFTDASTDAKTAALKTDLQTMRSAIELYKIQHTDALPGAGTGTFSDSMTGYTTLAGATCASTASGALGPYLQKIPTNAFDNSSTVTEGVATPGSGAGWYFNTSTGAFNANDSTAHAAW